MSDAPCSSAGSEPVGSLFGSLHAVVPLPSCPHLKKVEHLPAAGIDVESPCASCGIGAEVWVCLTCFQANCGRHVHEHALMHSLSSEHPMALSLADLSVWCYPCDSYVHNERCLPHKSEVHLKKFGVPAPN